MREPVGVVKLAGSWMTADGAERRRARDRARVRARSEVVRAHRAEHLRLAASLSWQKAAAVLARSYPDEYEAHYRAHLAVETPYGGPGLPVLTARRGPQPKPFATIG